MYKTFFVWALPNGQFREAYSDAAPVKQYTPAHLGFPLKEYLNGTMNSGQEFVAFTAILNSPDFNTLPAGAALYFGYGTSDQEMINAGRYRLKYVK